MYKRQVCYVTAFVVMLVLGAAQPGGPFAFPGVAGLMAVGGGLSPLLWMMQWHAESNLAVGAMLPWQAGHGLKKAEST